MTYIQIVGRVFLALVFVAGSWEDILPGLEGELDTPWSTSFPNDSMPSSDADDDAGDGFVLCLAPLDPLMDSQFDIASLIQLQSQLLQNHTEATPCSIEVCRISHVPKTSI